MSNYSESTKKYFFEKTKWYGEGRTDGCPLCTEEGYEDVRRMADFGKRLERAVFSQIKEIAGSKVELYIDDNGILRLRNIDSLSEEEQSALWDILHAYRTRVYDMHQFNDWKKKNKTTKKEYANWFTNAKESYLYTMPFKQLLELSDYDRYGHYTRNLYEIMSLHNGSDELTRPVDGLGYYCISDIKYILEFYLDPYILLSIIGKDVHIEKYEDVPYAVCTSNRGSKIFASLYSKELFNLRNGKLVPLGNSYEYMFKNLCLPVETVLNSVLEVRNYSMLPREFGIYGVESDLEKKLEKAYRSPDYKDASHLTHKTFFYR